MLLSLSYTKAKHLLKIWQRGLQIKNRIIKMRLAAIVENPSFIFKGKINPSRKRNAASKTKMTRPKSASSKMQRTLLVAQAQANYEGIVPLELVFL